MKKFIKLFNVNGSVSVFTVISITLVAVGFIALITISFFKIFK